jgi:hypothetical protein
MLAKISSTARYDDKDDDDRKDDRAKVIVRTISDDGSDR